MNLAGPATLPALMAGSVWRAATVRNCGGDAGERTVAEIFHPLSARKRASIKVQRVKIVAALEVEALLRLENRIHNA